MTFYILIGLASTALLTFCFHYVYTRGFRRGAERVLKSWKNSLTEGDNNYDN